MQGHQKVTESVHSEDSIEVHGNPNPSKSGLANTGSEKQAIERPKLNLKPRSQPAEQLEGNVERERLVMKIRDFKLLVNASDSGLFDLFLFIILK